MKDLTDDVIFRVWKSGMCKGDVIALWPAVDAGHARGQYCQSYAHIGQHGAADYRHVLANTRPAKGNEHHCLLAELRQRGYNPRVIRRATARHHDIRRGN